MVLSVGTEVILYNQESSPTVTPTCREVWLTRHRLHLDGTEYNNLFTLLTVTGGLCLLMCSEADNQHFNIVYIFNIYLLFSNVNNIFSSNVFLHWCAIKQSINPSMNDWTYFSFMQCIWYYVLLIFKCMFIARTFWKDIHNVFLISLKILSYIKQF